MREYHLPPASYTADQIHMLNTDHILYGSKLYPKKVRRKLLTQQLENIEMRRVVLTSCMKSCIKSTVLILTLFVFILYMTSCRYEIRQYLPTPIQ